MTRCTSKTPRRQEIWPAGCSERATAGSAFWPALRVRGLRTSGWRGSWRPVGENNDAGAGQRVIFGEYSAAGGAKALAKLVGAADPPDGVCCANDQIAIGALRAAKDLGLSVPGDIGITGFDDIEPAGYVEPALTTVANPAADYGRLTAELIIDRIEHRSLAPQEVIVQHRLVLRDSA